jgi:zinc/manganese transport system ATP-binding protein
MKTEQAPTISLSKVAVAYQGRMAIEGLTGTFAAGSLTSIIGANGGGKSTLFKAILGLVPLSHGQITLSGVAKREIAYLPQRSDIDRTFPISVGDVAAFGLWRKIGPFGRIGAELRAMVEAALVRVGLAGFERRPLDRLSGGELQRVLLARLDRKSVV